MAGGEVRQGVFGESVRGCEYVGRISEFGRV